MVYMDVAATAKYGSVDDIIVDAIALSMRDSWKNPSSLYYPNTKDKIDKCRANIAEFIGAEPNEVYFTSGASESNNWVIRGWDNAMKKSFYKKFNIISTQIEHKSIIDSLNDGLSATVYFCDVDKFGIVNCDSLEKLLSICSVNYEPILVSVCMANNEIGTIQDIKRISELVHKHDGLLHVDATQAFGHIPIKVEELGIDMMSCSGHKISPVLRGIGFLYKKNCINIQPLIYGAQENGMRGGTENTYGIIGLNKALEYCDIDNTMIELCEKRDYFINLLESKFGCKLNGHRKYRLPNNINVTFPQNVTGESLLYMLDISDIKIATGSACNSKAITPSHVLIAIGVNELDAMKSVRFTLPNDITYEEIDYVIDEISKCIKIIEAN